MSLYILFGLPGAGKTFVGEICKEYFHYYFYDGDSDLPEEMRQAIATKAVISDTMRDRFFASLIASIKKITTKHANIVVAQTFIKEKYREQMLKEIPEAKFMFIDTDVAIRESRLRNRVNYPLDETYARKMIDIFEKPKIHYYTINNNQTGKEAIINQLKLIPGFMRFF